MQIFDGRVKFEGPLGSTEFVVPVEDRYFEAYVPRRHLRGTRYTGTLLENVDELRNRMG